MVRGHNFHDFCSFEFAKVCFMAQNISCELERHVSLVVAVYKRQFKLIDRAILLIFALLYLVHQLLTRVEVSNYNIKFVCFSCSSISFHHMYFDAL